jgi:hypothetical protein
MPGNPLVSSSWSAMALALTPAWPAAALRQAPAAIPLIRSVRTRTPGPLSRPTGRKRMRTRWGRSHLCRTRPAWFGCSLGDGEATAKSPPPQGRTGLGPDEAHESRAGCRPLGSGPHQPDPAAHDPAVAPRPGGLSVPRDRRSDASAHPLDEGERHADRLCTCPCTTTRPSRATGPPARPNRPAAPGLKR